MSSAMNNHKPKERIGFPVFFPLETMLIRAEITATSESPLQGPLSHMSMASQQALWTPKLRMRLVRSCKSIVCRQTSPISPVTRPPKSKPFGFKRTPRGTRSCFSWLYTSLSNL